MASDKKLFIAIPSLVFLLILTYLLFGLIGLCKNLMVLSIYLIYVPILFFTYGAYIEKKVIENQVKDLVDDLKNDVNVFDYGGLKDIHIPTNESDDEEIERKNNDIKEESFTYLGITAVFGFLATVILWYISNKSFSYRKLFIQNTVLLVIVAITEILFFTFISKNYKTLDTNKVKRTLIEEISDKIK